MRLLRPLWRARNDVWTKGRDAGGLAMTIGLNKRDAIKIVLLIKKTYI